MPATKIATCCYCGTRAALRLEGRDRHELACSTCGAPLKSLKMLPKQAAAVHRPVSAAPPREIEQRRRREMHKSAKKPRKSKRRGGLLAKIWDEVKDEIEDIFD